MVGKTFILAAAGAASVNAACTFPYAANLPGNSIYKPSGSDTPTIGVPFQVVYDGTGLGPVLSFKLLRGPGNNIIETGSINDSVQNCGTSSCSWTWTPDSSLQPDTTHYGIKMVDESTCNYQYTTQFGLNAGSAKPSSPAPKPSSAAPKPSSAAAPKPSGSAPPKPSDSAMPSKPAPSGAYPSGTPAEDCDENGKPYPSGYKPAAPSAGPYTPPAAGWKASNGSSSTGAAPTYQPLQSNDGSRFAISAFGAIVAFAAAIMVL